MTERLLRTAVLLGGFWLVLSGHFTPLFLVLGALSVGLVCLLAYRAGLGDEDGAVLRMLVGLPRYLPWLGKEVLVSSVTVVRTVWSPRPVLAPVVEATPTGGLSTRSQVLYANSITLTPGTLSLSVHDDDIEVHALQREYMGGLAAGQMLGRVRRLDGDR